MSKTDRATWPKYLEALMRSQGLKTRAELARRIDIDGSIVTRWLSGSSQPSVAHLRTISQRTGAPLAQLLVVAGHIEPEDLDVETNMPVPPADVRAAIEASDLGERDKRLLLAQYEAMLAELARGDSGGEARGA